MILSQPNLKRGEKEKREGSKYAWDDIAQHSQTLTAATKC